MSTEDEFEYRDQGSYTYIIFKRKYTNEFEDEMLIYRTELEKCTKLKDINRKKCINKNRDNRNIENLLEFEKKICKLHLQTDPTLFLHKDFKTNLEIFLTENENIYACKYWKCDDDMITYYNDNKLVFDTKFKNLKIDQKYIDNLNLNKDKFSLILRWVHSLLNNTTDDNLPTIVFYINDCNIIDELIKKYVESELYKIINLSNIEDNNFLKLIPIPRFNIKIDNHIYYAIGSGYTKCMLQELNILNLFYDKEKNMFIQDLVYKQKSDAYEEPELILRKIQSGRSYIRKTRKNKKIKKSQIKYKNIKKKRKSRKNNKTRIKYKKKGLRKRKSRKNKKN